MNCFLFECSLKCSFYCDFKAECLASLLQSHDPSEIILMFWFAAQKVFIIMNMLTFTFTFSHLADAFIQSDLQLGST